jgi:hypothetical protein
MRLYCMAFSPGFPNYAPSGGPGNGSISPKEKTGEAGQ